MLGFTMRADGSSLFAKDNRWGYFPAVSAGWVVSEEKFWNVEKFNQLKLRLSYGLTGNNNVDYYDTLGAYSVTGIYAGSGATLASTLPNLGLTWEKTKQFDIGLDMAFFNNRTTITARSRKTCSSTSRCPIRRDTARPCRTSVRSASTVSNSKFRR